MTTLSDIEPLKPLQIAGLADYHCHCDYSVDAEGTIEEFCRAAISRNLAEICFVTHFDANPDSGGDVEYIRVDGEDRPTTIDNLAPYVNHVLRAAEEFYPRGLSVKLGIEMGWFEGCEELTDKLKRRYNFDYVLCGIHELDNICFCCSHSYEACFSRYSVQETVRRYFDQVRIAARSGLFDAIAHMAYYLRSGKDYYGDDILRAHEPYLDDVFNELIRSKTALEINTSAIRHGLKDYYPPVTIVNAARKAGVQVTFLGSDAHRPEQVAFDFEAALALVPDAVRGCEE